MPVVYYFSHLMQRDLEFRCVFSCLRLNEFFFIFVFVLLCFISFLSLLFCTIHFIPYACSGRGKHAQPDGLNSDLNDDRKINDDCVWIEIQCISIEIYIFTSIQRSPFESVHYHFVSFSIGIGTGICTFWINEIRISNKMYTKSFITKTDTKFVEEKTHKCQSKYIFSFKKSFSGISSSKLLTQLKSFAEFGLKSFQYMVFWKNIFFSLWQTKYCIWYKILCSIKLLT